MTIYFSTYSTIVICSFSACLAMVRGFTHEVLFIVSWVGAGWPRCTSRRRTAASRALVQSTELAKIAAATRCLRHRADRAVLITMPHLRHACSTSRIGALDRTLGRRFRRWPWAASWSGLPVLQLSGLRRGRRSVSEARLVPDPSADRSSLIEPCCRGPGRCRARPVEPDGRPGEPERQTYNPNPPAEAAAAGPASRGQGSPEGPSRTDAVERSLIERRGP